ncbi:hypothetical protein LTR57_015617 [Friedmanniomyces endolithicus]|uniref:E3 ubiquitin-protein ligase n=2 Tax=Friedmanniomyces endolithicus TaxID=329885 RepID=A0AAN6J7V2_9PEZI|nr:hypothetical protein LTS00_016032 [Friedmanniomyces endolithicus]KAK0274208.1 hypothetical protein LTR35_011717 [Friedmanniomyces endolithicus]KAK0311740.1 hypothetical protein LTR82_014112 [Friedmanniomyces endolithicus]KAK0910983.1 hypothetical protein LTR57_015617 [Friedmanniomyces endolithicus]KAK0983594.1 hypothetical protein LTR54_014259 [Friedmanniomyces endolithicus]
MAVSSIPKGGMTLRGGGRDADMAKADSAVSLTLGGGMVESMRKASQAREGLQFVTGSTPKLRIGGRTIDLTLSTDAFRNELYVSTSAGSLVNLQFAGLLSHRAVVQHRDRKPAESEAGTDGALAALRSTLATFKQEKQDNQTNIEKGLMAVPKGRFDAAKKHGRPGSAGAQSIASFSPSTTPLRYPPPTSAPATASDLMVHAMRTPILHLLAMRPATAESIRLKTHVPRADLDGILQKIARKVDGEWQLADRSYKDLDVWSFGYCSEEDRQSAVDNAVRAYDRLRIGKEEKVWQGLLSEEQRGKGVILSRLHSAGQVNLNGRVTPSAAARDSQPNSNSNTPMISSSTPRPGSSKGDVMKRILTAKDPKKARAVEDAKEKKRKEREAAREAAASDREMAKATKRQALKKVQSKIKSAEIVQSSEDESGEEGEVKDDHSVKRVALQTGPNKPGPNRERSKARTPPDSSSDGPSAGTKRKEPPNAAKSIASLANQAAKTSVATDKASTPRTTTNGLSAPLSHHQSQRSPQKHDSRPSVPSPLGAARPRVASDVTNRGIGARHAKPGAATPLGLGITNGARKRHDTVTGTESAVPSGYDKMRDEGKGVQRAASKPTVNGTPKAMANRTPEVVPSGKANGVKRSAEDPPEENATKHRKTTSTSSQSQVSHNTSSATTQSTARTSPDVTFDSGSSDSAASVLDTITYTQGVTLAEKFRDQYYPAYAAMYDAQAAEEMKGEMVGTEERERLWAMHRRLEQMKREIRVAGEREQREF